MANEGVLKIRKSNPVPFTVAEATGIEKGALLKMTDPRTAVISAGASQVPAGIIAEEKISGNGITTAGLFKDGRWDLFAASGNSISVGDQVILSGENGIREALTDGTQDHLVIGRALETASAGGETIEVDVNF